MLGAFKNISQPIIFWMPCRLIMEKKSNNCIMNQFWLKINILHILSTPYSKQHKGVIKAFNKTVQDF